MVDHLLGRRDGSFCFLELRRTWSLLGKIFRNPNGLCETELPLCRTTRCSAARLGNRVWGWEGIALKASSYKQLRTKKFQFPSRFPLLKFSCKDEELWMSWLSLGYRKKPLEMILLLSPKRMWGSYQDAFVIGGESSSHNHSLDYFSWP